jgi:ATP/maltotriose-dependent transcriptional regulator MalT
MTNENKQSLLEKWLDNEHWCENEYIKAHRKSFEFDKICEEIDLIISECDFLRIIASGISLDNTIIRVILGCSDNTVSLHLNYYSKKLQIKNCLRNLDSKKADRGTGSIEGHV